MKKTKRGCLRLMKDGTDEGRRRQNFIITFAWASHFLSIAFELPQLQLTESFSQVFSLRIRLQLPFNAEGEPRLLFRLASESWISSTRMGEFLKFISTRRVLKFNKKFSSYQLELCGCFPTVGRCLTLIMALFTFSLPPKHSANPPSHIRVNGRQNEILVQKWTFNVVLLILNKHKWISLSSPTHSTVNLLFRCFPFWLRYNIHRNRKRYRKTIFTNVWLRGSSSEISNQRGKVSVWPSILPERFYLLWKSF